MSDNKIDLFEENVINECILEVRYKPNSKVLDFRGEWAESLSSVFNLPHWRISENRVDVYDKELPEEFYERGYISFRKFGFVFRNAPSGNKFSDRVNDLIKFVFDQRSVFSKEIFIERIGIRTRIGNKFKRDFSELLNLYLTNYLTPTKRTLDIFEADIIDFGGSLTLKSSNGFEMNIITGPMEGKQLSKFFPFEENPPEPQLYFEIDSFMLPNQEMNKFKIIQFINTLIRNNWSLNNKVLDVISGN